MADVSGVLIYCDEDAERLNVNYKAVDDARKYMASTIQGEIKSAVSMGAVSKIAYRVGLPMKMNRKLGDSRYFGEGRNDNAANLAAECEISDSDFGIPPRHFGRCDDSYTGTVIAMPDCGWNMKLEHVEALCEFANEFVLNNDECLPLEPDPRDERMKELLYKAKDMQQEEYTKAVLTPQAFKAFWETFRGRSARQANRPKELLEIYNWELPIGFPIIR